MSTCDPRRTNLYPVGAVHGLHQPGLSTETSRWDRPSPRGRTSRTCCLRANENPRPLRYLIFRGSIPHPMQSLCTLRDHCRQWPRNTRYQADATPYLGRTYMRRPLSRTFFGLAKKVLRGDGDSAALMARQTPTAGRSRWSSPVAVRGAPKAQGLMNGSAPLIMRPCL